MVVKITPKLILIILFVGIVSLQLNSQNVFLNLKKADHTEKNIQLSLLKKITFVGTDLVLNYQSGSTENVTVSTIQKVTFSSYTALSNTFEDDNTFSVYPNPSSEYIYLNNAPTGMTSVSIYSISGIQVMNLILVDKKIDISQLAKGIYLIKVNNQVSKFTKL
jgi:hypothetical protein